MSIESLMVTSPSILSLRQLEPFPPVTMLKKRVLITGATGLLGTHWATALADEYDVILGVHQRKLSLPNCRSQHLAWNDRQLFESQLDQLDPDIIVHTAGLTSVDECERRPDDARRLNVDLAVLIANYCASRENSLVHISSDHLFDGSQPLLDETAPTCPVNQYGKTKADAETQVLSVCPDALVLRTNFFGWGPSYRRSFSDWIIDSLRADKKIDAFDDVFYTPILIPTFVTAAMELLQARHRGIHHLTGPERLSKYDFALRVALQFRLDVSLIQPAQIASASHLVRRPHDMSLSISRAQSILPASMPSLEEQLHLLAASESNSLTN